MPFETRTLAFGKLIKYLKTGSKWEICQGLQIELHSNIDSKVSISIVSILSIGREIGAPLLISPLCYTGDTIGTRYRDVLREIP